MAKRQLFLKIFGQVQGVGFRYFLLKQAKVFSLYGWAKNMDDGTVECLVEGEEKILNKFKEIAEKGPTSAKVEKVEEKWGEASDEFLDFEIR
jgi:acylphosphatase